MPDSRLEWDCYYELRWRVLRAPWAQARGSERDELEAAAFHLMIAGESGEALACGRLHLVSSARAQIRYMAVAEQCRGRGYGGRILEALEVEARRRGAAEIILEAREDAARFYMRAGYGVIGPGKTLFETIRHVKMIKFLR